MSQQLDHIAEVSKNARATWFAMLGVLLFAIIALGGVRDRDFFIADAGTTLPLVTIQVPTVAFFIATPLLILSIHAYFHLYLIKLWRALRPRSNDIAQGRALDEAVYPWLIADAAIYLRPDAPARTLGWLTQTVSVLFGWAAAPVALMLFWIRSWAPHDEWLSVFLAMVFVASAGIAAVSLLLGRAFLRAAPDAPEPLWTEAAPRWAWAGFAAAAAALLLYSWAKTEGLDLTCQPYIKQPYCGPEDFGGPLLRVALYPAQLQQAEIVERPSDWRPRREAREAFLADYAGLTRSAVRDILAEVPAPPPPWLARIKDLAGFMESMFMSSAPPSPARFESSPASAWLEAAHVEFAARRADRIRGLRRRDFRTGRPLIGAFGAADPADFRNADLSGAFLAGIDLSGAAGRSVGDEKALDIPGADLRGARLDGADLEAASLVNVDLSSGRCPPVLASFDHPAGVATGAACTSLRRARLELANLSDASLRGACLRHAVLTGATAERANFDRADLYQADLTGASLFRATLSGARLVETTLVRADLRRARLAAADLSRAAANDAFLSGADLSDVTAGGAEFDSARLEGTDLTRAALSGARLSDASLFRATMAQARLDFAILTGASLRGALLAGADLDGAMLHGADLSTATLDGARLAGAVGDAETRLPPAHPAYRIRRCFAPPTSAFPDSAWLAFRAQQYARNLRALASRTGLPYTEFADKHVCMADDVAPGITGPTASPHTR